MKWLAVYHTILVQKVVYCYDVNASERAGGKMAAAASGAVPTKRSEKCEQVVAKQAAGVAQVDRTEESTATCNVTWAGSFDIEQNSHVEDRIAA